MIHENSRRRPPSAASRLTAKTGFGFLATVLLLNILANVVLAADGDFDTTFNGTGTRVTDFGNTGDLGRGIFYQSDGKIVVAGQGGSALCALRYTNTGQLDTSFDTDGIACSSLGSVGWTGALQSDGKVIVAGTSGTSAALVRFNSDGTLDSTFGTSGGVTTPIGGGSLRFSALLIQPDGKLILVGFHTPGGPNARDILLLRYDANGALDTTFDGDGIVRSDLTLNGTEEAYDAVLLSSGKILVAGRKAASSGFFDALIARYNVDGSLDTSFDGDGYVLTDISAPGSLSTNDNANAVTISPNGSILIAGSYTNQTTGQQSIALVRYMSDGSLDASFDGDGMLKLGTGVGGTDVLVQADTKIIAAISTGVIKLNDNGSYDTSFGTGGSGQTALNGSQKVALQSDGKILTTGGVLVGATTAITTSRLINSVSAIPPSSAPVTLGGRVTDSRGRPIAGAILKLVDARGSIRSAVTNTFGYYRFNELDSGETYFVTISAKRYRFANASRAVSLIEEVMNFDFIAEP